jgi:hypothetical protein
MGLNTTTKTVQNVFSDIRRTFGDESSVQITDEDMLRWINTAQREILISNKILKTVGTTDVLGNVSEYSLAGLNIVSIQSIHFMGQKLEWRSFQDAEEYIMSADPGKTAIANPTMWYEWGGIINLYPVPQDDLAAGLKIYYIKEPDAATVDSTLIVPDAYYETVLQFCLSKAYELDEDPTNSQFKLTQYTERLNVLAEQENTPEIDTYQRITVLSEDM